MTGDQLQKVAASLFSICAALAGFVFLRLDWAPRIDFDITGFLWALSNAGRLTALVLFVFFAGVAVSFWVRVYRDGW